jgi:hypothetical protein
VSFNDLGDNQIPLEGREIVPRPPPLPPVVGPYSLETEMPENWWGVACAAGGFTPTPTAPAVFDPTPKAAPVAAAWRAGEADAVPGCLDAVP